MRLTIVAASFMLAAPAYADKIFVGAGDIAMCGEQNDEKTAALLDAIPGTVFTIGDGAYEKGTVEQFANCYGPSWGRHKNRTRPSVGNHEYMTSSAQPYRAYFQTPLNYAYDLGNWHIVSLDSNCERPENGGSCGSTSPTMQWLRENLALNNKNCTLVYFHHPRWTSGSGHGNSTKMSAAWQIMHEAGVDVVLSAHAHNYERFAPLNPQGVVDRAKGIRSFVVGTGGAPLSSFGAIKPGSEVRNGTTHGVLKLTLGAADYKWKFVPVAGKTFTDSGSGACH